MTVSQNAPRLAHAFAKLAALGLIVLASAALADEPKLETESYLIPSVDPGIQLYIRNKHPAGVTSFAGDRILLYVHGATYPSETAFDLPLNGRSMMDYIAQQGFDVYLVDVRGYGASTRPPEMDQPPADNKPIVDTPTAAKDVGAAVDHILQKRGVAKLNLMGWSWGTAIMGLYTTAPEQQGENCNAKFLHPSLLRWRRALAAITGRDCCRRTSIRRHNGPRFPQYPWAHRSAGFPGRCSCRE
jgi:pimeloyl-ACP methyl ester carboxylesterase